MRILLSTFALALKKFFSVIVKYEELVVARLFNRTMQEKRPSADRTQNGAISLVF